MDNNYYDQVQSDFDRARMQEVFSNVFSLMSSENDELLSLNEIRSLLKSNTLTYKGMMPIEVSKIVGSEGRYRDFNRRFLPKSQHLRSRWESIDLAHYTQKNLPPIQVYEIGGLYFVRDGNHRVSVAKSQNVEFIDAEVTSLNSEIPLHPKMRKKEMIKAVIEYEKKIFFDKTQLDILRPDNAIEFTSVGRYDEILLHINGHKYYLNECQKEEIPFQVAMLSWYDQVFKPIYDSITKENILSRFPNRTPADLYVWIVHIWDKLKHQYGNDYPIREAVLEYTKTHGSGFLKVVSGITRRLLKNLLGMGVHSS